MDEDEFMVGQTRLSPGAPVKIYYREGTNAEEKIVSLEGTLLGENFNGIYVRVARREMPITKSLKDLLEVKEKIESMDIDEIMQIIWSVEKSWVRRVKAAKYPYQTLLDIVVDRDEHVMVDLQAPTEEYLARDTVTRMTYLLDEATNDALSRLAADR